MAEIGFLPPPDTLVLWRGRDFKWNFENLDLDNNPTPFPEGCDLFFEFIVGTSKVEWHFVIDGPKASIKVESEVADLVPSRTEWQLVLLVDGELEGGDPVGHGTVYRIGGKG
ncbi:hypothetical protein PBI_SOUPS_6 [Gordonia phage Soups]|uniref:LtfC/p132/Gp6 beta-sandwich domain-containing protein n=1 Tax=Gordonia phage Soups TaxID=1838079 RepID=A0A160DIH6_9CAUD|nr:hypothetical protein BEN59_gp006 [Gordonia phage Soups]ANA86944.1 hypothetical protein PBI_SOUPS_6 [Gordonia phage Soups]